MTKLLLINDCHLSDKPPANRKSSYLEDIFAKIQECKNIAATTACNYTLISGDVFHHPRANAVTHHLVSRTIEAFRDWPTPIYAIAGNHDLSESGVASIEKQPIFVLQKSGVLKLFHQQGFWINNETYIYCCSWDSNDKEKYWIKRPSGCRFYALLCHDMLFPEGSYPFDYISHESVSGNFDAIFYGHVHFDIGVRKVNNTYFLSAGSLSRVAKSEETINRKMRVAVADIERGKMNVEFFPLLSAKSYDEVFIITDSPNEDYSQFGDYIQKITNHKIESVDLYSYINNLDIEDNIKDKMRYYLFEMSE